MSALNRSEDARARRFADLDAQPFASASSETSVRRAWRPILDVVRRRELLGLLVRRDLRAKYKDSALGFVWSLIRPLTQLLIYYVVVGQFLRAAEGIPQFAVYVFCGLTIYALFSETVTGATGSIVGNSGLIKKIALPREIFPLASVGAALVNFAVQSGILIVAAIGFQSLRFSSELLFAPASVFLLLIYGLALGLLLSAVNVYLRDVQYLVEVGLLVLLWASPIVYSWSMAKNVLGNGILLDVYTGNPVTLAVLGFQRAFWAGAAPDAVFPADLGLRMLLAGLIGLIAVFLAHRVFVRLQGDFAQEL